MRTWIVPSLMMMLAACGDRVEPAPATTDAAPLLVAVPVPEGTGVRLDASLADPVWKAAQALTVALAGEGPGEVTLLAAHDAERFYLFAHWPDEGISLNRFWRYVGPVQWERHTGEDAFSLCWSPGALREPFQEQGCALFCHEGRHVYPQQPVPGKDYADFWFWGAQTTLPFGQARDMWLPFGERQRLRGDRQPADSDLQPNLSREFEGPGHVPAYIDANATRILTPANMQPLPRERLEHKLPVERNLGWEVPLDILRPMRGSRGDVRAAAKHAGGRWLLELERALNTGNTDDQPLGDPLVPQRFAVAIHDGTDGGAHSYSGPIELRLLPTR